MNSPKQTFDGLKERSEILKEAFKKAQEGLFGSDTEASLFIETNTDLKNCETLQDAYENLCRSRARIVRNEMEASLDIARYALDRAAFLYNSGKPVLSNETDHERFQGIFIHIGTQEAGLSDLLKDIDKNVSIDPQGMAGSKLDYFMSLRKEIGEYDLEDKYSAEVVDLMNRFKNINQQRMILSQDLADTLKRPENKGLSGWLSSWQEKRGSLDEEINSIKPLFESHVDLGQIHFDKVENSIAQLFILKQREVELGDMNTRGTREYLFRDSNYVLKSLDNELNNAKVYSQQMGL